MNRIDINEIRRGLHPDRTSADYIRGCYVDERGEIISMFAHSLQMLPQEEGEKYLALFRKVLSGVPGKNLVEIPFRPDQVAEGEEHRLLTALKDTSLKVDQAVEKFFQKVIDALTFEGNYVILLMHDNHDVAWRPKDEMKMDDAPAGDVFSHILCAVCPVKQSRPALSYSTEDRTFHEREQDWVVSAPDLGFLFPAFEDGGANIYAAMCYSRDASDAHEEFVDAVFGGDAPMPAAEQKEIFEAILSDSLESECALEVVQTVHEQIRDLVEEHKADKQAEPPTITKREVSSMLQECGVSEERVAAFETRYDEEFGPTDLRVQNIVDVKRFELRTPDVVVKVNPERSDLIQTRTIDGSRYILIRADEGVEVNGVNISISDLGEDIEE